MSLTTAVLVWSAVLILNYWHAVREMSTSELARTAIVLTITSAVVYASLRIVYP